jgi:hypothetical protein
MNKKSRGVIAIGVEWWGWGASIARVEQLREAIATIDDEHYFLVMSRLKDF